MRTRIATRDLRCKICSTFIVRGSVIAAGAGPVRCVACAEAGKTFASATSKTPPAPKPTTPSETEPTRPQSELDAEAVAKNPKLAVVDIDEAAREMTIRFDSVHDAIKDATSDHAANHENLEYLRHRYKSVKGDNFVNYHSYETLTESLAKPKPAILKSIAEMSASIGQESPPVEVKRRRLRGVDFGDEINVDRYLAHDPMCWDRQQFHYKPKSVITIGVNLVTPGVEDEEAVRWRGAAAAALADRLIQLGYSVGIVALYHVTGIATRINDCHTRTVIKAPDAPLDIAAVATSIADIGFARIVGMYGSARHVPSRLTPGLGFAATVPMRFRDGIDYLVDSDIRTRESAIKWLESNTAAAQAAESDVLAV